MEDLDNWPRMIQLAYIATDEIGKVLSEDNWIIKPNGFIIPKVVSDIHGITNEIAHEKGVELEEVLDNLIHVLDDNIETLVAHNMAYDEKIIGAEFLRIKKYNHIHPRAKICTMLASKTFCALPGPYGFKWPKLDELHRKLFQEDFVGAHDALFDIRATVKCFFKLKQIGVIK